MLGAAVAAGAVAGRCMQLGSSDGGKREVDSSERILKGIRDIPCKISSTDSKHPGAQNDHYRGLRDMCMDSRNCEMIGVHFFRRDIDRKMLCLGPRHYFAL